MRVAFRGRPLDRVPRTEAERAVRRRTALALVSMPFAAHTHPSLQISLLKARAEQFGFPAATFHLTLDLAAAIGGERYDALSVHRGDALGDWLFAVEAFREDAPDPAGQLPEVLAARWRERGLPGLPIDAEELRRIRDVVVPAYLDGMVDQHPWGEFAVIGFTATFQQTVPSFALARRIKERHPHVFVVFGGANFEGPMGREHLRSVPWIDGAIDGEADVALPELLAAVAEGRDPLLVRGVIGRRDDVVVGRSSEPFDALDELPVPDYGEFFERAERLGLLPPGGRREVDLPFESARGCWWGERRHCTFCGLNATTMAYRTKSPQRVLDEMAVLARRHRSFQFVAVDNILEPSLLDTLMPAIARQGFTYRLFYEVKSNLNREQLRVLRDAGVRAVQPGIESLSSHVLALMRKGVRASQNVALLKWARHLGIEVHWNLLFGFPHETVADYEEQRRLIPRLVHLDPPNGAQRIWMERFSPLFRDADQFPRASLRPEASLVYAYPRRYDLAESAYFFDYDLEDTLPDDAFVDVVGAVADWRARATADPSPQLRSWHSPGFLQIDDTRTSDRPGTWTFESPIADLYLATDERPVSARQICDRLRLPNPVEEIEEALDELVAQGLVMRDGELFLGLAIPAGP